MEKFITKCEAETAAVAKKFAETLEPGSIVAFKGGLGAVSDASAMENPVQSLTNMVYVWGESYYQVRAEHEPAIQAALDEINAYIDEIS